MLSASLVASLATLGTAATAEVRCRATSLLDLGFATATVVNNFDHVAGTSADRHLLLFDGKHALDLGSGFDNVTLIAPRAINDRDQILCDCFSESPEVSGPCLLTPIAEPVPARLANVSIRAAARTGNETTILGFTLGGGVGESFAPMTGTVFMRTAGPALAGFGVGGVLADPQLWLHADGKPVMGNDDWGSAAGFPLLARTMADAGAFALPDGSKDAALLLQLEPGAYTVHVSGADGGTGVALIELYLAP